MRKPTLLFVLLVSISVAASWILFKPNTSNIQAMEAMPAQLRLSHSDIMLLGTGKVLVNEMKINPGRKTRGKTYEARILLESDFNHIYETLTKFECCDKYMPNVKKSTVISRKKGEAVVNYTLGMPFGMVKKYRLRMTYLKNKEDAIIRWKLLPWPELSKKETIGDTEGYWMLKKITGKKNSVLLTYRVYADPGNIPKGFEWIVNRFTKKSIPDLMTAVKLRTSQQAEKAAPRKERLKCHLSYKPLHHTSFDSKIFHPKSEALVSQP